MPLSPHVLLIAGAILCVGCASGANTPGAPLSALAARASAPEAETQHEFRMQLSRAGYEKLARAFAWGAERSRTDLYFDRFDGRRFVLRSAESPLQFRLKLKKSGIAWQLSRVAERRRVEGAALPLSLNVTRAYEGKLKGSEPAGLVTASEAFFAALEADPAELARRAEAVSRGWEALSWPGAPLLAAEPGAAAPIVPIASKRNHARTVALDVNDGRRLTLMLGRAEVRREDGRWIEIYEVEAEPTEAWPAHTFASGGRALDAALVAAGLGADDEGSLKPDSAAYTLRKLVR